MNSIACAILTTVLALSPCVGADLKSMRTTYEDKRFEISATHSDGMRRLAKEYVEALDGAIDVLRQRGEPVPVVEAQKIRDAAAASGTVPEGPQENAPDVIRNVQARVSAAAEKALQDREARLRALGQHYLNALEREMKDLTAKGEIESALQFKKEADAIERLLAKVEKPPVSKRPEEAADSPDFGGVEVRTVPLLGGKTGGQWQKQLFTIPAGSFVRVSAAPKESLSNAEPEHRCFSVKLGKDGEEKWFNSNGRHNFKVKVKKDERKTFAWRSTEFAEFQADREDSLYVLQTQNISFTLTVSVSSKPYVPASERRRRKRK